MLPPRAVAGRRRLLPLSFLLRLMCPLLSAPPCLWRMHYSPILPFLMPHRGHHRPAAHEYIIEVHVAAHKHHCVPERPAAWSKAMERPTPRQEVPMEALERMVAHEAAGGIGIGCVWGGVSVASHGGMVWLFWLWFCVLCA